MRFAYDYYRKKLQSEKTRAWTSDYHEDSIRQLIIEPEDSCSYVATITFVPASLKIAVSDLEQAI